VGRKSSEAEGVKFYSYDTDEKIEYVGRSRKKAEKKPDTGLIGVAHRPSKT